MAEVAFLGLGAMGYPMAGHLARAGHNVRVYNRSPEKSFAWAREHTGNAVTSAAGAAEGCEFVISCVGNDRDVDEVFAAAAPAMARGGIFIDHTTASATLARRLAESAKGQGISFLDAPVSGGTAGAQNGRLTVMAGGENEAFERASPVMKAYAASATLIGPSGAGQLAKMVNQICIAGLVQGLAEGLHFAQRADLDIERVIAAISKGAAQSWQMENRWKTMVDGKFDFGFAVDWMRKDLGLIADAAKANGADLPVTALVDSFYAEIQAMGGGRWDTSSLIARLKG
ncbi:MAG TPA: NAD(P)-dependent oxidoreductase [Caulobacterales bacterium]|nr:NAD(P)-dependent oxidoreductase [Caulobacterales bacterium]